MKTSIRALLATLSVATSAWSANLFWDPSNVFLPPNGNNSGAGSGNWGDGIGGWDTGALGGAPATWASLDTANFQNTGTGGTATLFTSVLATQVNVLSNGHTIDISNSSTNLTVLNTLNLNGNSFQLQGSQASGTATYVFASGITAGNLTLNKSSGTAGTNLIVNSGGNVFANTTISSSAGGLVGYAATANLNVSGTIVNSSAARTLLSANPGVTLTLASGANVSGTSTVQIGTGSNTGTVNLNGGTIAAATPIDVVGGTFQVSSTLAATNVTVQSGGTLALGASNVMSDSTTLTLNGGIFAANGFSDTLGSLTLTASSVLDFAGANSSIRFAMIDVSTWGGATLSVWNWTQNGDHLFADAVNGFLPDLGHYQGLYTPLITFYADNGNTLAVPPYTAGGWSPTPQSYAGTNGLAFEIIPVPEPTAALSSLLLVLAIGWRERGLFARRRTAVA